MTRMRDFCLQIHATESSFQRKLRRFTTAKLVNPVSFTLYKSLDPSFRWDDERFGYSARHSPDSNGLRRNDGEAIRGIRVCALIYAGSM